MPDALTALVIGCGRIGSLFDENGSGPPLSHAGAYVAHPGVRLGGVCDPDPARVARAAERWGRVPAFVSVEQALERSRPELVSICTPDDSHAAVLRLVLASRCVKAVLVEKPLACALSDAVELADLARTRGVPLLVNYSRRFHSGYRALKDHLASGALGAIERVAGYYSNGVLHNGSHWFDLARWLVGDATVHSASFAAAEYPDDPTLHVQLAFSCGATGHLVGLRQSNYAIFEMDILGATARVRIGAGPCFEWAVARDSERYPGFRHLYADHIDQPAPESAMLSAIDNMVACAHERALPLCGGEDAVAAMRLAEAARLAAARQ